MRFNEDGTELLGGATFTKFKYDDNKGNSTSLEYYSYDNSNSDTWVIKCTGSNGSDDDKLRELIKKNLNDNHFILAGSGGDGKVIDFYDSQIFNKDNIKKLDFQGFSGGCESATDLAGMYINEQISNGNTDYNVHLTLCDPGDPSKNNQLFGKNVNYNANSNNDLVQITNDYITNFNSDLENISPGCLNKINEMVRKGSLPDEIKTSILGEYGITLQSDPVDLSTYAAFKEKPPISTIFVSSNSQTSRNGEWKTRPDFLILASCSEKTTVFDFSDIGHLPMNNSFAEFFGGQETNITEEKFIEIIQSEGFKSVGVWDSNENKFIEHSKSDLFDVNGEIKQEVVSEVYVSLNSSNSSDTVSIDYEFVNSNIDQLLDLVKRCDILTLDNVKIDTGGMLTLETANKYFNDYAGTSKSLLLELNRTYNTILQIAASVDKLDRSLAESINLNEYINSLPSYKYLMDINLTSIDDFYKGYSVKDFTTPLISKDVKITTDMLFDLLSDRNIMRYSLIEDIRDTTRIRDNLDNFIETSKDTLKGTALDLMRKKLTEYSTICDSKIKYAETLMNTMHDSFTELLNYMEDYGMLDTAMIPEVQSQISTVQTQINNLEQQLASLEHMHGMPITETDENGESRIVGYIDNSAEMAAVSAQIAELEIVLAELNYLKNKLEGLKPKDQSTAEKITNVGLTSQIIDVTEI